MTSKEDQRGQRGLRCCHIPPPHPPTLLSGARSRSTAGMGGKAQRGLGTSQGDEGEECGCRRKPR